jgi:hypothetical protein
MRLWAMPKRRSKNEDVNQAAFRIVREATSEPIPITSVKKRKNPAAVSLGRMGGLKSGKARMEKLTPEQRRQLASNAARKRWAREKAT